MLLYLVIVTLLGEIADRHLLLNGDIVAVEGDVGPSVFNRLDS